MAWNPDTYNKFKNERYQPFYDLLSLIKRKENLQAIDLGCGTGELTRKLADELSKSSVTGIDSSAEMLTDAQFFSNAHVSFEQKTIEEIAKSPRRYDLVFSHAAIQWVDDHKNLLPQLIKLLNKNGQLAIQIPANDNAFTHTALRELAAEEPYRSALKGWEKISPVLDIEKYGRIFFENGCKEMILYEKLYPHVLKDADAVFEWTLGTAILRYTEKLPEGLKQDFTETYKEKIHKEYHNSPVFFPYRRILMYGIFN